MLKVGDLVHITGKKDNDCRLRHTDGGDPLVFRVVGTMPHPKFRSQNVWLWLEEDEYDGYDGTAIIHESPSGVCTPTLVDDRSAFPMEFKTRRVGE